MQKLCFRLVLCLGLGSPLHAIAQQDGWARLMQAQGPLSSGNLFVIATLLERQGAPSMKPPDLVGSTGVPENHNARKLRLEVRGATGQPVLRVHELAFPSLTGQEDPCSIRQPLWLKVEGGRITIAVQYQVACGSGSGGEVEVAMSWRNKALQVDSFSSSSASREALTQASIDFKGGLASYLSHLPEIEQPPKPLVRQHGVRNMDLSRLFHERCPRPLKGHIPQCTLP